MIEWGIIFSTRIEGAHSVFDFSKALAHSDERKKAIAAALEENSQRVLATAQSIYEEPEVSFEEVESAKKLTAVLSDAGFEVQQPFGGLDTAFRATRGSGSLVVSLCVEYDALEGVGHACGHNLIAGASLGAGLALAGVVDELDITLHVIGTPAEEHGGGKQIMIENGAFDGVHLSLMAHGGPDQGTYNPIGSTSQAVGRFRTTYTGKGAHAAGAPHDGINAGDAATIAQVAAGLLRQQVEDGRRFALVTKQGGVLTNIIPSTAVIEWECRAVTMEDWQALHDRIVKCLEAGAHATGCSMETVSTEPMYEPLLQNLTLAEAWNDAMRVLGRPVEGSLGINAASTDMGNVSQRVPSLHPFVGVTGSNAALHTADFQKVAGTDAAYDLMFDSAIAMAWIINDVASGRERRAQILSDATELAKKAAH